MEPTEEIIQELIRLRKQARFLDAWALLKDFAPPEAWTHPKHRASAARLIENLGDDRRATAIRFKLWRRSSTRFAVREDMVWHVLQTRGPYLTWEWLLKHPPQPDESEDVPRDHPGIQAYLLGRLRDFERAESFLQSLFETTTEPAWAHSIHADLLASQDRHEEALEAEERALAIRPALVSAVLGQHDLLLKLGRDEEALANLTRHAAACQSGAIFARLANLQIELERYDDARVSLDEHERVCPLANADLRAWSAARRCDLASAQGDHDEALRQAKLAAEASGFYRKVAEYLEKATGALTRRILPVGFVAQHHLTCAPATVSAVAAFLGQEVEHLTLADEICYDGTPDYRERSWAETHGWAVREFRVTVASAKALIDRGIPVILTMVYPDSAHAQAVIGYDEFRQVLFVRDPSYRTTTEFLALEALETQLPFGPRGLVMVPMEERARLDGLELPEAELYDLKHAFDGALERHDRTAALAVLEQMRRDHPQERLRWFVELALARYDHNTQARLDGLEALLAIYPQVINWQLGRLDAIRELRGRETFTQELRTACASANSHPLLWRMLARELHWDARHADEAQRWLRRYHRVRVDPIAILTTANLLWQQRRWEEATGVYRMATCLDDRNEDLSMSYFKAARWVRRTDEALQLLRARFQRFGNLSALPAISLYEALDMLNRRDEGLAVLEAAWRQRPADTSLGLFYTRSLLGSGEVARSQEVLAQLQGSASPAEWMRCQAEIAGREADNHQELACWKAVLEREPLAADAHRAVARLLELLEGHEAALRHLREACRQFPYHWHLHSLLHSFVQEDGLEEEEKAVRELLRIDSQNAWAWRQMAEVMRQLKRFAEAHQALEQSFVHEPHSPAHFGVLGALLQAEERFGEARVAYRRAIELDADSTAAMRALLEICTSPAERLQELRFIQAEISRQVTSGAGVLEFADIAGPYVDPPEMESFLRDGYGQRPDLWQTGVCLAAHLRTHDRVDESIQVMDEVCGRFPLLPRVWLELGLCYGLKPDRVKQIEALSQVRQMSPGWGWGMRLLADALKKTGSYPEALEVLEQALRHSPADAWNHGWAAEVQWHLGQKAEAIQSLRKAVELEPGYNWAWGALRDWGALAGQPGAAMEAARVLTRERPAEARSWLILADMLTEPGEFPEQMEALDRAIAAAPRTVAGYDEKARCLALAGRFEEAFAVCEAHPDLVRPPLLLAREAWILWSQRDATAAISRMQSAVAADPALLWGWTQLAQWHQERDELDAAETAVFHMCQLEPEDPSHLGQLALIREKRNDTAGQVAALERALGIAPDYAFALRKLLEWHRSHQRYDKARELIQASRPHYPFIEYLSRLFCWHWGQGQYPEAGDVLFHMVAEPDASAVAYNRLLDEFRRNEPSRQERKLAAKLGRFLAGQPLGNLYSAHFYVNWMDRLKRPARWDVIRRVPVDDGGGLATMSSYIELIAERWDRVHQGELQFAGRALECWRLDRLLRARRDLLRAHDELWGTVSYALYTMNRYRETIAWLADWRERPHVEPYMLNNLFFSLQHLDRVEQSNEVLRRGLELPRHGEITMRFHIFAALDDLLSRKTESARKHLAYVQEDGLVSYTSICYRFAQELLPYQPGSPRRPFNGAVEIAVENFLKNNRGNPAARRLVQRACQLISGHNANIRANLWYFTHRHRLWLIAAGGGITALVMRWLQLE